MSILHLQTDIIYIKNDVYITHTNRYHILCRLKRYYTYKKILYIIHKNIIHSNRYYILYMQTDIMYHTYKKMSILHIQTGMEKNFLKITGLFCKRDL